MSAERFWSDGDERHQEIAKTFYENIELQHPGHLTGRSCREIGWCGCSWCATSIKYWSYNGPRVQNI